MRKYKYLTLILAIIIFISFYISWTIIVLKGATSNVDNDILQFAVSNRGEKGNFIYSFNRIITELGNTYVIVALLLIIVILLKGNLKSIGVVVGVSTAALFNEIIKKPYGRLRPDESYRWMVETSYSYPSGHSNMATILYGFIIYLIIKSNLNKKKKVIFIPLILIIPFLVYSSRIILSVHYFSDVIGGITNGFMFLSISILVIELLYDKTNFDGLKPLIDKKLNKEKGEQA